jgi:hypothetical protein
VRQRVVCTYSPGKALLSTVGIAPEHQVLAPLPEALEHRLAQIEARLGAITDSQSSQGLGPLDELDHATENFQGGTAFQAPVAAIESSLGSVRAELGIRDRCSIGTFVPAHHHAASPSQVIRRTFSISVGRDSLAFPEPTAYESYLDFFFKDINPCHSCVNEADFRSKAIALISTQRIKREDLWFLALNYIIFACADILQDTNTEVHNKELPGWNWFQIAEELIGNRKVGGGGDASLVQYLIYEAFYLMHADKPNAAYNSIGLACRRCFQFGLHQGTGGNSSGDELTVHMRQRLLWTVYFVDRRISLSCGRPYGMRDHDIRLDLPQPIDDAEIQASQALPAPNPGRSSIPYLHSMIAFSKLAGEVWDRLFASGASQSDTEAIVVLDAKIKHWLDTVFPKLQLIPPDGKITRRHHRQHTLIVTRFDHLRLLLRRRVMVSLEYDGLTGQLCGDLATNIVNQIGQHRNEVAEPSSFRFHMAVSLGGAVLVLATLIIRDLSQIGLQDKRIMFTSAFDDGLNLLDHLSVCLTSAKRISDDLKPIVQVATTVRSRLTTSSSLNTPVDDLDSVLPHGVIDFAQQTSWIGEDHFNLSVEPASQADNLDFFTFEPWGTEVDHASAGYGAPWI